MTCSAWAQVYFYKTRCALSAFFWSIPLTRPKWSLSAPLSTQNVRYPQTQAPNTLDLILSCTPPTISQHDGQKFRAITRGSHSYSSSSLLRQLLAEDEPKNRPVRCPSNGQRERRLLRCTRRNTKFPPLSLIDICHLPCDSIRQSRRE